MVVWSPLLKSDMFLIENVQSLATKLVKSIRNLSYEERMKHTGLPALRYGRAQNIRVGRSENILFFINFLYADFRTKLLLGLICQQNNYKTYK